MHLPAFPPKTNSAWRVLTLAIGLAAASHADDLLPPFPRDEGEAIRIEARCGLAGEGIDLVWSRNSREDLRLRLRTVNMTARNHHWNMKVEGGIDPLSDAGIMITLSGQHGWKSMEGDRMAPLSRLLFIRPDVHFYQQPRDQARILAEWDNLPPASTHPLILQLVRRGNRLAIWIDGHYFSSVPLADWASLALTATDGAEILSSAASPTLGTPEFLPLLLETHPHATGRAAGKSSLKTGVHHLAGVPFQVLAPDRALDVGLSRWLMQDFDSASFYNPYYRRSSWDAVPESLIRSIPRAHYNRLHLICAVDPERSPEMTIRLARYRQAWDGSGATQADVDLVLDPSVGASQDVHLERIGEIEKDGPPWPLFRVSLPLPTGELAEYLRFEGMDWNEPADFFYLEFSRKIEPRVNINNGVFERLPLGPQSGIHVLAATLQKSPLGVFVESEALGHVFQRPAKPALNVRLVNADKSDRAVRLEFHFKDFFGQDFERNIPATAKAQGETSIEVSLHDLPFGWYASDLRVTDEAENIFWQEHLNLALLPEDSRQAGFDDPPHYGTWWFQRSHYSEAYAERALPLIRKMGFRFVSAGSWLEGGRQAETYGVLPEVYARHGISPSQIKVSQSARDVRNPPDPEKLTEAYRSLYQRWPNARYAMIFHEMSGMPSLGLDLPPELLGLPPPAIDGEEAEWRDRLRAHIARHAQAIRSGAPGLDILLGNSGPNFNMHWARENLPRPHWDALGMEQAVQLFSPEGQPNGYNIQSFWLARQMLDLHGLDDMPVTTCYEVGYRATAPGALTLKRQADWYARDVLHMLAHRVPDVNIALLMDCNSSYYSSRWGSSGVLTHYPEMQPKPSYIALATLTRVLDLAKYNRFLHTGSHGLHAMEFSVGDDFVTVFWTTRGSVETRLHPDGNGEIVQTDLMGRESKRTAENGRLSLSVGESPVFVRTPQPLSEAVAGTWTHADAVPSGKCVTVDTLTEAGTWKVAEGKTDYLENWCAYKPVIRGDVEIENDAEGLRVSLRPAPETPGLVGRYVTLERTGKPLTLSGRPEMLGIEVEGNSAWGRVIFEFRDAEDRDWVSIGWEESPNGWDMSDWEDNTSIGFDGRRFLIMPLPGLYASGYYTPHFRHWRCLGDNRRDNRPRFPIAIQRMHLILRDRFVYLDRMVPARTRSIRLQNLIAVEP